MKQRLRIFLFSSLGLLMAVILYLSLSSEARFINYCDRFFQEELSSNSLTMHYTVAEPENYGIDSGEISLGNYSTDTSGQKRWLLGKYLTLHSIVKGALPDELQKTYALLEYCLKTELAGVDYPLLEEPLVPSIGIQSQLPILLAEYSFESEDDVKNYLALLACVPEYFDSILALEEEKRENGLFMDQESAEELITYCEEFLSDRQDHFLVQTFEERLTSLSLPSEKQTLYIAENASVLETSVYPAYEALKEFLAANKDSGNNENGLYYYPEGTEYYAWLLRSDAGCDRSFKEIETLLENALKAEARSIVEVTKDHPELLEQQKNISFDTSNPAALTTYLSKRAEHDFPEIPEVNFEIRDVPKSMEAHLSPAFYLVPAIDRYEENVVYLNNGYLTKGISFFTTLAHESYPGHLYQTVYENTTAPHPVHRLLYFGGYTEGWGTYAEQMSYNYAPISEDLATLLSATRAMTLNL